MTGELGNALIKVGVVEELFCRATADDFPHAFEHGLMQVLIEECSELGRVKRSPANNACDEVV